MNISWVRWPEVFSVSETAENVSQTHHAPFVMLILQVTNSYSCDINRINNRVSPSEIYFCCNDITCMGKWCLSLRSNLGSPHFATSSNIVLWEKIAYFLLSCCGENYVPVQSLKNRWDPPSGEKVFFFPPLDWKALWMFYQFLPCGLFCGLHPPPGGWCVSKPQVKTLLTL